MNFQILKNHFEEYVRKNAEASITENNSTNSTSIFSNSNLFKKYLQEELNADQSIFSSSINAILNMEIVDNKLVAPEDLENEENSEILNEINRQSSLIGAITDSDDEIPDGDGAEASADSPDTAVPADENAAPAAADGATGAVGAEGATTPASNENELNGQDLAIGILNELMGDESFQKLFDANKDGQINQEELLNFLTEANGYDGDSSTLSLEDILSALADKNPAVDSPEDKKDEDKVDETENQENNSSVPSVTPSPSTGGSSGVSSVGGYSSGGYNSGSVQAANAEKTLDNMSLDELKSKKASKETEVNNAKNELDSINSGEKYSEEQAKVDDLKAAYEDALKNDENTPPELIDCLNNIDTTEKEISDYKVKITDAESDILTKENTYNSTNTTLKALEATQRNLNAETGKDDEAKAEIEQKKSEIAAKISEVKAQLAKDEAALNAAKEAKTNLEKDLAKAEQTLNDLNAQKTELEEQVKENCSEKTKQAMEAYNEAKTNLDTKKSQDLSTAQQNYETKVNELKEIEEKINIKEAQAVANQYEVSPLGKYNEQAGQALADAAQSLYGNVTGSGGYCARGVSQALGKAFGMDTSGDAWTYKETLANCSNFVDATECYPSSSDLSSLPAGAIVVWSKYNGSSGQWGHVAISDGKGGEISDHHVDHFYDMSNKGGTYTIYLPV